MKTLPTAEQRPNSFSSDWRDNSQISLVKKPEDDVHNYSNLLIMIIKLANFGCYFSNLPSFEIVFHIKNVPVLLLEFP